MLELISTLAVFHMDSFGMDTKGGGKNQHMVVSFSLSNHCPTCQNPHNGCFSFIKLFLYIENTHMRTCPGSPSLRAILRESFLFAD